LILVAFPSFQDGVLACRGRPATEQAATLSAMIIATELNVFVSS
jgi:hypothetical protein